MILHKVFIFHYLSDSWRGKLGRGREMFHIMFRTEWCLLSSAYRFLTGLCKMQCYLSNEEKLLSKNLSQEEKVHCRFPYAASAAASVTKQSFPGKTLLGELPFPGKAPHRLFPTSRVRGECSVGICCSSAWYQQRQRSDDRPFLLEKLGLSSKTPSSLKHIWINPRVYRSRRGTLSCPFVLMLFCHTKYMSRVKGRMDELTQKKAVQKSWAISPQKINDKRLWIKPICNGM